MKHDRHKTPELVLKRDRPTYYWWPAGQTGTPEEYAISQYLIPWINEHHAGVSAKRLSHLLEVASKACDLTRGISASEWSVRHPMYAQLRLLEEEMNGLLRQYKGVRRAILSNCVEARWHHVEGGSGLRAQEFAVALVIIDGAERDLLQKVKQCCCGKFFFARSSLTRFCSKECRVSYWESSEQRKEQKRKKAREYYRLHKYKNVK